MQNSEINQAIKYLAGNDNTLSTIIKNIGIINLRPHRNYFNALLRSIVGQQLSVYAAAKINERFMKHYNYCPVPKLIIDTDSRLLRRLGLSNAKVKYVKNLSVKMLDGEINLKKLSRKNDDEIIEMLTIVKGIGVWTVHMFLIFTLGRLNVLPYSDLGIRKAVMLNYKLKKLPDEKRIKAIAKKYNWYPYCSIVSLYLWKSLDNKFESILD
jgi:DNA-3-methyladenine glycosylase II